MCCARHDRLDPENAVKISYGHRSCMIVCLLAEHVSASVIVDFYLLQ